MNLEQVLRHRFPEIEQTVTPQGAMLYALGIGMGDRPDDAGDLQFVYEQDLQIFPSQVNVLCHPGAWVREPALQMDWVRLLHGEQSFEIFTPLQPGKTYTGMHRVLGVSDKGEGKGALLFLRKELREKGSSPLVGTVDSTYFLRGDGGYGGTGIQAPAPHALPARAPDGSVAIAISERAALI